MLLLDLFRLSPAPYVHACESPRAPWVVGALLAATGCFYGALMALFQLDAGGALGGIPVAEIPLYILILGNAASGIIITVAVHVGITIIAWMMARAIGGPGLMIGLYRSTAYLLPFLWFVLPFAARASAVQPGAEATQVGPGFAAAAVLGLVLFLHGLFQVYLITQGRGPKRAVLGVVLFALFTGSVLYIAGAA